MVGIKLYSSISSSCSPKVIIENRYEKLLESINNFVFAEPLSEKNSTSYFGDEAFKDEEEIQDSIILNECFDEDGKFKHEKVCRTSSPANEHSYRQRAMLCL